jgi:septation ring formation regulator EzrA
MPKGRKIEPKLSERAMKLIAVLRAIDTSRVPSAPDEAFAGFSHWGHAVFDVLAESIEALRNGEITARENAAIGKESQRITRAMHEHLRRMKQKRTH